MTGKSTVVLLSGGLDSTVSLWWARNEPYSALRTLSFSYGSKEEAVSLQTSRVLAGLAGAEHTQLDLDVLRTIAGEHSALVGDGEIPPGLDGPDCCEYFQGRTPYHLHTSNAVESWNTDGVCLGDTTITGNLGESDIL